MIRHVVMWKLHEFADGHNKAENALRVKSALESLIGRVDGLVSLQVGVNQLPGEQAFDLVLMCDFRDWAALETYRTHPLHLGVIELLNKVRSGRVVADWEV